ncbi:MAG: hypothetical protein DCC67_20595 [Planctomycetota bacterium]|nr:MAG: hypothetical protein DCC67_20595 [Planctomycetota bacterium]
MNRKRRLVLRAVLLGEGNAMKASFLGRRRREPARRRRDGRLSLERLEARYVLDGVTLAGDLFDVGQNSLAAPLDVLANDFFPADYAGQRRITSISFGSEGGAISVAADGRSLAYAPPADYFGAEVFTYVVDDQFAAEVQVRIHAPLAHDAYTIVPDGLQRPLDVLANDPFWASYAGARVITSVSTASAGGEAILAADGRSILYTPPEEPHGDDQFIYIVDGRYPARVTISIPQPLQPDQVELVQHTPTTFHLLANDPFWAGYGSTKGRRPSSPATAARCSTPPPPAPPGPTRSATSSTGPTRRA